MHSVLIVDDSATARLALRIAIEKDRALHVIGEADCGSEALALARRLHPDVVTMDVMMRSENGIDIAATMMAQCPCPIVIVTSCDTSDPKLAYRALQVGALELVSKLPGPREADYEERVFALTRLLRNVARISVVTPHAQEAPSTLALASSPHSESDVAPKLVVIGASTGGPNTVRELLAALAPKQAVPIALAQHTARGFGAGFAEWLADVTGHRTVYADRRMLLEPGTVYVAPDDGDLILDGQLWGNPRPPSSAQGTPSVDALFQSAAATMGAAVVAVLMTGMGRDGAVGMRTLAQVGATTIVQDPKTCTVSSMPIAAIRAVPNSAVLTPAAIAETLHRLLRTS